MPVLVRVERKPGSGKGKHRDGRPGAGLLRPERTEILAPGDRSRDDRLPKSQGEKRSCVPGEKQGFRVWIRGRDKAGNVAKPESGSFCRIQV